MPKSIRSKLPIRTILFFTRQVKSLILQKNKNLEIWLKVWRDVRKFLPEREAEKAEWTIFEGMKDIPFTFEESHNLYNEGLYRCLGRKAMWLGACLASNAIERQRYETKSCENIMDLMLRTLSPYENDEISKEDRIAVRIINGEFKIMTSAMPRY